MVPLAKPRNTPQSAEHDGSSPYSPQPATCHILTPRTPIHTPQSDFKIHLNITFSSSLTSCPFPAGFTAKHYWFLFSPLESHAPPISPSFTWESYEHSGGSTNHEQPHYAISSSFLLFHSTSKYSPRHPVLEHPHATFVLHTYTKQVNYGSVYFNLHVFV
jgi:hypothetical protein